MKEQHKIWQNEWRQIMGKTIDVDVEPDCDFDLHFDIWDLEKKDFFKLFERFVNGAEIAQRAYQLRWGDLGDLNKKMTDEELIQQTKMTIEILQKIQPSDELIDPKIIIKKGDDKLRLDLLSHADSISSEVDDEFSTYVKKSTGDLGHNAYFFLKEPMYRMSSSYIPCNWILWCLTDYHNLNPYTPLLKMEYNGCDVALTNDGVLIYQLVNEK
ncbi:MULTISPECIES: hypothetical protein [Flavobacteriaceae]|uniref:hypothetical protein n=1 Tax=Flavobacteriaceae TaxID=49546 RepID=UPI0014926260|nr:MULTISPECIES: hypothetical protein [Allomuricauda]MDC6367689.1 hypothetical protein [Muricauda sp. AC10]